MPLSEHVDGRQDADGWEESVVELAGSSSGSARFARLVPGEVST